MLFSSMIFLWIFFPFVIIGNTLLSVLPISSGKQRIRCKNYFLLACSLFFYAWGGIYYVLIMIGVFVLDFFGHIGRYPNRERAGKEFCGLLFS